jgi:hypothetical protein
MANIAFLVFAFISGAFLRALDTVDIEIFNLLAISFMVAGLFIQRLFKWKVVKIFFENTGYVTGIVAGFQKLNNIYISC